MASEDFIRLATLLYEKRYDVVSIERQAWKSEGGFRLRVRVVLECGSDRETIESTERDFVEHTLQIQRTADAGGRYRLTRIKDLDRYRSDMEHLTDEGHAKVRKAWRELASGKFVFQYEPIAVLDSFLMGRRGPRKASLSLLKTDYYYVVAYMLEHSRQTLQLQEALLKKRPEAKRFVEASDYVLRSFRRTGNPIGDYKLFRKYACFDIDALFRSASTPLDVTEDTIQQLIKRGTVPGRIGVLNMVQIYSQWIELIAPIINLLRAGLEIGGGKESPAERCSMRRNVSVLKSNPDYGTLFSCLDEMIRHSHAHVSVQAKDGHLYLYDRSGKETKLVREYTFQEVVDMTQTMLYELGPAVLTALVLHEMAALDLVLLSYEYKYSLLALDNS